MMSLLLVFVIFETIFSGFIGAYVNLEISNTGSDFIQGIASVNPVNGTIILDKPLFFRKVGDIIPDIDGKTCQFYDVTVAPGIVNRACSDLKSVGGDIILPWGSYEARFFGKDGGIWVIYEGHGGEHGNSIALLKDSDYVFKMDFDNSCIMEDFCLDDTRENLFIRCKRNNKTVSLEGGDDWSNRLYQLDLKVFNVTKSYDIEKGTGFYEGMKFYDSKIFGIRKKGGKDNDANFGYFDIQEWKEVDLLPIKNIQGLTASASNKNLYYSQCEDSSSGVDRKSSSSWIVFDMEKGVQVSSNQMPKDTYVRMTFVDF